MFGKRARKHMIIFASGDKIRHMTVHPWMGALGVCLVTVFSIGYLAATSYLVLRDDLIGGTMARQARMQHDYEDRISALRAQVDRVTSRQLLDQQVVEEKVEKLLRQQMALNSRHGKLGSVLERAENSGIDMGEVPVPTVNPQAYDKRADAGAGIDAIERLMGLTAGETAGTQEAQPVLAFAPRATLQESAADRADRLFSNVTLSLKGIEQEQLTRIQTLTVGASETAEAIETILARTGVDIAAKDTAAVETRSDETAIGGPFVEPVSTNVFDDSLVALDAALNRLERTRRQARNLPISNPSPASEITSRFGNRVDPFLGRLALHAGIDFRAAIGTNIRVTGPGTVITAGKMGGYGNMVEVDHGNGLTSRYAHLSAIRVHVGDSVASGDVIGEAGSTGRSTGPHLHYEIRVNGTAIDPIGFLTAGNKLARYLN